MLPQLRHGSGLWCRLPSLRVSSVLLGQRAEEPLHQEPPCEQEPTISCWTEECKSQGAPGQQGLGGDLGRWKRREQRPEPLTLRAWAFIPHCSLNIMLLLFPCRTQSHPLRPDNHRQHPDAVRGSHVQGGLWVLPLWWALLRALRHSAGHSPMPGTETGPCEQHAACSSPHVFLHHI